MHFVTDGHLPALSLSVALLISIYKFKLGKLGSRSARKTLL